ncbi:MAG: hypothetical protein CL878_13790 [Dehalococcoidia bacterium]|nr:hypothetical protein [Dehalococcoidia bacterium]
MEGVGVMAMFSAGLVGAVVGGVFGVKALVLGAMRERTKQLQAQAQPSDELKARLARVEQQLGALAERQEQFDEAVNWQQQLLERPTGGLPSDEHSS